MKLSLRVLSWRSLQASVLNFLFISFFVPLSRDSESGIIFSETTGTRLSVHTVLCAIHPARKLSLFPSVLVIRPHWFSPVLSCIEFENSKTGESAGAECRNKLSSARTSNGDFKILLGCQILGLVFTIIWTSSMCIIPIIHALLHSYIYLPQVSFCSSLSQIYSSCSSS